VDKEDIIPVEGTILVEGTVIPHLEDMGMVGMTNTAVLLVTINVSLISISGIKGRMIGRDGKRRVDLGLYLRERK
jgi:hypothetical protein